MWESIRFARTSPARRQLAREQARLADMDTSIAIWPVPALSKASEPARSRTATDRPNIGTFEAVAAEAETGIAARDVTARPRLDRIRDDAAGAQVTDGDAASKRSFDAFAMQMFIESILPDETVRLFGTGSAGKMWKSMLAEKLAEQVVASGRVPLVPETGPTKVSTMQVSGSPAPLLVGDRPTPGGTGGLSSWVTEVIPGERGADSGPSAEPIADWSLEIR